MARAANVCAAALAWLSCPAFGAGLAEPLFFSQEWCPIEAELAALDQHFDLTRNGCCIFRADRRDASDPTTRRLIEQHRAHIVALPDMNVCTGDNPELRAANERSERQAAAARAEEAARERVTLPARLREKDAETLCLAVGSLSRNEDWLIDAPSMRSAALPLVIAEVRRRGLNVNIERVKKASIRVGDSECTMFAALGVPHARNRTANTSGISSQWVYGGGLYVYTVKGFITAWQD